MTRSPLLVCALVTLAAAPSLAQSPSAPPAAPRGVVSVNGGWQAPSRTFSDSFTFDQYAEPGTADVEYTVDPGPVFEGGFGMRLWKALGVGVSASKFNRSSTAHVTGSMPHPFFFSRPRTIEGDATGITRDETTINLQALAFVPAGSRVLLVLSAGPSFISVQQDLVTAVKWDESYPFDTATYRTVDTTTPSEHAVGVNVGADVIFRFGRSFGLGALIRFTQAKVDLVPAAGRTVSVDAGGFQAGAGFRILY
jgi:hypothetical protein